MELGLLKHYLWRKNISYYKLAKIMGTYPSTVCNKINGKSNFSLAEVILISRYLKLSKDEIYRIFFI